MEPTSGARIESLAGAVKILRENDFGFSEAEIENSIVCLTRELEAGDLEKLEEKIGSKGIVTGAYKKKTFRDFENLLCEELFSLFETSTIKRSERFDSFLGKARELEAKIIGLEPGNARVYEYSSGKRLVYDAVTDGFMDSGLGMAVLGSSYKTIGDYQAFQLYFCSPQGRERLKESFFGNKSFKFFKMKLGLMSGMIMGQCDFLEKMPTADGEIRIVVPNIRKYAASNRIDPGLYEQSVVLHEDIHNLTLRNSELTKRENELLAVIYSEDGERGDAAGEELEAILTAIEGHADFFTGMISKELLNFEHCAKVSGPAEWILAGCEKKLFGLGKIVERYEKGRGFIKYLYSKDPAAVNLVLSDPPKTMAEIENPSAYLQRVK